MSMLQTIRKVSKTAGKGTLYLAGGAALAVPAIMTVQHLMQGSGLNKSLEEGVYAATGYSMSDGTVHGDATGVAVVRTLVGAGAVYVAAKL